MLKKKSFRFDKKTRFYEKIGSSQIKLLPLISRILLSFQQFEELDSVVKI
jgi:hypothetical protein